MTKRAGSARSVRRVLLTGLACALLAGTAAGQPAATAPPTRVVFDDFSNPTTGWRQHAPNGGIEMAYRDGTYQVLMTTPTPLQLIDSGVPRFANGVVSVDLANSAGSGAHPQGVFVRAQDVDNYYGFVVQSDGTYTIYRWEGGRYFGLTLPNERLPEGLYLADGLNAIDVIADGTILRFFLNYREVFSLPDAKWNDGTTGLIVGNLSFDPAGTVFDNWRVEIAR